MNESTTKHDKKIYLSLAVLATSLLLAPGIYGYHAHSTTDNLVNAVNTAIHHYNNPILKPFFDLAGVSTKDYIAMSHALEKGISEDIAEKLYPVDKMKAGERWFPRTGKDKKPDKERG
jgi:hypothetical protein